MVPIVARAELLDSIRFSLFHALPMALQGVFRKRPFWVRAVGRLHPDPLGRRFVLRLRAKYRAPYVDLSMLGRRTRLVLDPDGIRAVLERSPDVYAAPKSKRNGMALFQPNAATVSSMPDWVARRQLNELVLSAAVAPPLDDHFLRVVREEVGRWHTRSPGHLGWGDLQEMFDRITLRVVFGDAASEDRPLLRTLDTLMARANRILFRRPSAPAFAALYGKIERYLASADPMSLVGIASQALLTPHAWPGGEVPPAGTVRAEGQVPHWLFAMKDTLASNTAAAIALFSVRPGTEAEVGSHPSGDYPATAADVHAATLLEGCVQEGMRLWPTTPMLLRESACGGVLGELHGPGLQVLIWNAANHRDPALVPNPDEYDPARWACSDTQWQFNHLSNGRQRCAGTRLALFLAKAVLVELTARARFTLRNPRLPADGMMPESFDFFGLELDARSP